MMKRLSVVITNYNYASFLGEAIDSALGLHWDDVEVVVSDDGSTDGSADVIRGYGDRVTAIFADNGGQRVAANRGYARTSGDVVIFLDSDDALPADLPAQMASSFSDSVSKVQFQMQRVNSAGVRIGTPFPDYDPVPTPADIRRWVTATSAYPTPPGSGNAYARWFLDEVMPVGETVGDFVDSALLAAAPFFGDVVSLPGPVVLYRQHGRNDSDLLADPTRFAREVDRARNRWLYSQRLNAADTSVVDERALFRSRELLQFRVSALRQSTGRSSLPGDSRRRVLLDTLRSPFQVGPEPLRRRLLIAGWCLAVQFAPEAAVGPLLRLRYHP